MKKFSERGVPAKETPREVAESSDVIITMLPSSSNVSYLHLLFLVHLVLYLFHSDCFYIFNLILLGHISAGSFIFIFLDFSHGPAEIYFGL